MFVSPINSFNNNVSVNNRNRTKNLNNSISSVNFKHNPEQLRTMLPKDVFSRVCEDQRWFLGNNSELRSCISKFLGKDIVEAEVNKSVINAGSDEMAHLIAGLAYERAPITNFTLYEILKDGRLSRCESVFLLFSSPYKEGCDVVCIQSKDPLYKEINKKIQSISSIQEYNQDLVDKYVQGDPEAVAKLGGEGKSFFYKTDVFKESVDAVNEFLDTCYRVQQDAKNRPPHKYTLKDFERHYDII